MRALVELIVYVLEVIKFFAIAEWIIGLKHTEKPYKYIEIPIVFSMGIITYISQEYSLYIDFILLASIILIWFHEKIGLSILCMVIEFLAVSFIDLIMWLICVVMTPLGDLIITNELLVDFIGNVLGIIPVLIISFIVHKKHISLKQNLKDIKFTRYLLIIAMMITMLVVESLMQGMIKGEIYLEAKRLIMIACTILSFFVVALCVLYIYVADSRRKITEINALNEECIENQKNYYAKVLKKDEELRAFKHDVNKHIGSLQALLRENKIQELGEYLDSIDNENQVDYIYKTGNLIADYVINGKIKDIKKTCPLKVKIIGKFPPDLKLKNTEMCIILANTLDNAKEAIEEFEGEKSLEIEIRNFKNRIYITIKNSSPKRKYQLGVTTKHDKENHGYGMKNVERVVEKYQGNIHTDWSNNIFTTKIEILNIDSI